MQIKFNPAMLRTQNLLKIKCGRVLMDWLIKSKDTKKGVEVFC